MSVVRQSDDRPGAGATAEKSASISSAPAPPAGLDYWLQVVLTSAPLLLADALAAGGANACASALTGRFWSIGRLPVMPLWLLVTAALLLTYVFVRLYPGAGLNPVAELRSIVKATLSVYAVFLAAAWGFAATSLSTLMLFGGCLGSLLAVPLARGLARSLAARFRWWGQPVLIFGRGETARRLHQHYLAYPRLGLRPVGVVDLAAGGSLALPTTPRHVFWAIATTPLSAAVVRACAASFPHVLVVRNELRELPSLRNHATSCGGLSATLLTNRLLLPLPRWVKFLMDYMLVVAGGLLCLPLIAIIAAAIKLTSRGPVFYAQQRIGRGNRPIRAWKFRTMVLDADQVLEKYLAADPQLREEWERDHKLKNDPRVTVVGRLLRKTSLDELPQLWNVLTGEMSLVGPRPIVTAEIPKYGDSFPLYTSVMPGITGLWQISGRNNTSYEERVLFDSYYALNWSPWLDLYILARTIAVVLRREGAY